MRFTLILLFLALHSHANAQLKVKLNYTRSWELTTPRTAFYVREAGYDSVNMCFDGPVTDLFPNGKPQMTGSYVAKQKQGEFTFYFDNGVIESSGRFENDQRSGTWKYFYRNGRPRMEVDFAPVLGDDAVIHFLNDSTGQPLLKNGNGEWREVAYYSNGIRQTTIGQYKNFQKDGTWTYSTSDAKIIREEVFKEGQFKRGTLRDQNGKSPVYEALDYTVWLPDKFYYTENFFAKSNVDFSTYPLLMKMYVNGSMIYKHPAPVLALNSPPSFPQPDSTSGKEETFTIVDNPATPKEGLANFYVAMEKIASKLPADIAPCGRSERVFVEFVIEKDGSISDPKVVKSVSPACDRKALETLDRYARSHQWNPGSQNGNPVRMRYVLPFKFD